MGNDEEATDSDIMPDDSQGEETLEDAKMTERRGNVYENKGPVAEFGIMNGELLRSALVRASTSGV
jgi:hypothetical protein